MKPRISRAIAKWLWLPALASSLVACGGAQKTSAGEGGSAPPPPQVLIPKVKVIDRTVSQSAKKDFAAAVAAFRDAEKLGWTEDRCVAIGEKFADIGRSGEKMVEAWFDAGVSYQKCGDGKKAEGFYKSRRESRGSTPW